MTPCRPRFQEALVAAAGFCCVAKGLPRMTEAKSDAEA